MFTELTLKSWISDMFALPYLNSKGKIIGGGANTLPPSSHRSRLLWKFLTLVWTLKCSTIWFYLPNSLLFTCTIRLFFSFSFLEAIYKIKIRFCVRASNLCITVYTIYIIFKNSQIGIGLIQDVFVNHLKMPKGHLPKNIWKIW